MKVILSNAPQIEWKTLDKFTPGDVVVAKVYDHPGCFPYLVFRNDIVETNQLLTMNNYPSLAVFDYKTSLFRLCDKLEMNVGLP